jgi:hypothetical protein
MCRARLPILIPQRSVNHFRLRITFDLGTFYLLPPSTSQFYNTRLRRQLVSSIDVMKLPLIKPFATALVILVSPVVAHRAYTGNKRHENYRNGLRSVLDEDQIWRRQAPTIAPPPPAAPTNAPLFDGNSIPPLADITSGMPIQNTVAFETTFAVSICGTMSSGLKFSHFLIILLL